MSYIFLILINIVLKVLFDEKTIAVTTVQNTGLNTIVILIWHILI